jgi:ABC-type sugar transport system ATPase subunit
MTEPAVMAQDLGKRFGGTVALSDINLDLERERIHALVGENGAGKSTFLGVIAGRIAPSVGEVQIFGEHLRRGDPRAALRAGVASIYQELAIVPALSTQANVFLGQPVARASFLSEREMRNRYVSECKKLGVTAYPDVPAGALSVADQQLIEVMRALVRPSCRLLLFDEPTASLSGHARTALLELMAALRDSGRTLIFVSHNLDEVLEVADTVTVFRDGRLVSTQPRRNWTKRALVSAMLGEVVDDDLARELRADDEGGAPSGDRAPPTAPRVGSRDVVLVRAESLTVPGCVTDVTLELRDREMLGLGGLVGSGRSSVVRALAGLEPGARGRLWIKGKAVPWPKTPRQARRLGIALLPEDRKRQGLALRASAADNIALSNFGRVARHGFLSERGMRKALAPSAAAAGFDTNRLGDRALSLSGGNQQKLLLARWIYNLPDVLLADEPTRGVDVGAKREILDRIKPLVATGKLGMILVSSELEELAATCDRILVLAEGRCVGELSRSEGNLHAAAILALAFDVRHSYPGDARVG